MRIYGFGEYGDVRVQGHLDGPEPVPGPGQLLVVMTAAGVNPADIKVRSGLRRDDVAVVFPMAMGREAAGVVRAVGAGVVGFRAGQRVFGQTVAGTGAMARLVLLEAASSAVVPEGVEDALAACIPVSVGTAHDALDQLGLAPGETLLVTGAGGGVGTAACQLARLRGVRVVGLASADKADLVTSLGATHVSSGAGWPERVRAVAGAGVAAVFDLVGPAVLADAVALAADPARVISVAAPAAARRAGGSGVVRRRTTEVFTHLAGLIASGDLRPVVSGAYPFERAADAVAAVETGHAAGKVVVVGAPHLVVHRRAAHRRMPWRNGGGLTAEVTRSPTEGDDFDWRVSFAEVAAGGPFSSFAGVDRVIVVVDGPGLVLTVDGVEHALRRHEPFAFPGEGDATATTSGPTVDLNVMTRRGRCTATVDVVPVQEAGPVDLAADGELLVAVLDGAVSVSSAGDHITAERLDVVASAVPVTVSGVGVVAVVRLSAL